MVVVGGFESTGGVPAGDGAGSVLSVEGASRPSASAPSAERIASDSHAAAAAALPPPGGHSSWAVGLAHVAASCGVPAEQLASGETAFDFSHVCTQSLPGTSEDCGRFHRRRWRRSPAGRCTCGWTRQRQSWPAGGSQRRCWLHRASVVSSQSTR